MRRFAHSQDEVEAWYREYGAALLLFGTALTGHRGRAQDALHQVFLRLLDRRQLDPIADARTYLFAALRNTLINKAMRRGRNVPLDSHGAWWFECPKGYVEELSIRRALTDLPPDQREVVVLHIWGGLTFAQATEVLSINANTAAARYRYALPNSGTVCRRGTGRLYVHSWTEDQQLETHLRTFHPLRPAPLPKRHSRRGFVALSSAAAVFIGLISLEPNRRRARSAAAEPQPMTIGRASLLLARTASWKDVVDGCGFAFRASPVTQAAKNGSALDFLSQEDLSR